MNETLHATESVTIDRALIDGLKVALEVLIRTTPPIQAGTLCEEQEHDYAIRSVMAAIKQAEQRQS